MTKWNHSVQAQSASVWLLFVIASLWLAISLSWWVYARFDYGYSFWYDQLAIGAHIQRYVPKHPDKADFAQLPKEQHIEAFRQIRVAVHDGGAGLEMILYPGESGVRALLDEAEVRHLRDVAHLLDLAALAFWPVLVLWAALAWYLGRRPLPPWRFRIGVLAGLTVAVALTFAVVGAKQIFYALHVWLFPPENQWFFYWELSLMSAMMKAPYLFGGIAVVLATAGGLLAFLQYSGAPQGRATTWSNILTAFQPVARDHQGVLPLAPCWRVGRAHVLDSSPAALTSELAELAGEQAHYWVLQQGPLAPGSRRESLLNLDTDMALAAALGQTFRRADSPDSLIFQCMPPQRAAGVLFSRHPMRPDLDHIVIEGCLQGSDQQQRVILHADGALAWRSDGADAFLDELGTAAFHQLAQSLHDSYGEPRAAEWIWDGQRLWLVQALPIGTLPMPSEVWTRRAGLGFAAQAISPLWYTMMARWLKEGFWRVIGQRAGWRELGNIEPYRRQHSYLYGNARFFRALQQWQHGASLWWALPPAWRNRLAAPVRSDRDRPLSRAACRLRLLWLRKRLQSSELLSADASADEVWLALIRLDRLGEQLARIEGALGYIQAPSVRARGAAPLPADVLSGEGIAQLVALADVADGRVDWDAFCQRFSEHSAGADPVFPRLQEQAADVAALPALLAQLPEQRRASLRKLTALRVHNSGWLALRRDAAQLRQQLAGQMRILLKAMAQRLVALRRIRHPDDIFFLYFDELWQVWQGESRRQLETLLGERKVRYLSDAHAGPPDWIIDSIGYGTSPLGQTSAHDTVRGYALVPGQAEGRVQRLGSGWQLNQVQAGDILVLDQSDAGWLPWITLAGGLVLSHRDPLDPVAALAVALGIPTIWGVDDAMHCLPDGVTVALDGESGVVRQV